MASQMVRLFLRYAGQVKQSSAVVFLDLQNAFYSVERALVMSRPTGTPRQLLQRLAAMGASPAM
eukprot:7027483-Alexandrium_andersonii.AAC.1